MKDISGPVVAIALILAAVFIPVGFIPGIVGRLYQQFAITIAISVLISAFVALSLTPALCSLFLRPSVDRAGRRRGSTGSSSGSTPGSRGQPGSYVSRGPEVHPRVPLCDHYSRLPLCCDIIPLQAKATGSSRPKTKDVSTSRSSCPKPLPPREAWKS